MSDFWFNFNMTGLIIFGVIPWGVSFGIYGLSVQLAAALIFIPILIKYKGL